MQTIVHIGLPKTGTKTIQWALAANRDALLCDGLLYSATLGRTYHWLLAAHAAGLQSGHEAKAWAGELVHPEYEDIAAAIDLFCAEVATLRPRTVLVSSEHLSSQLTTTAQIVAVRDVLARLGAPVRVVIYLRPFLDFVQSRYAEMVKNGATKAFDVAEVLACPDLWDYASIIARWADVFGSAHITIRPFPVADVVGDFMATIGHPDLKVRHKSEKHNASPDAVGIDLLRRLNQWRDGFARADQRAILTMLARTNTGAGFRIGLADHQALRGSIETACIALKLRFPDVPFWDDIFALPAPNDAPEAVSEAALLDRSLRLFAMSLTAKP